MTFFLGQKKYKKSENINRNLLSLKEQIALHIARVGLLTAM